MLSQKLSCHTQNEYRNSAIISFLINKMNKLDIIFAITGILTALLFFISWIMSKKASDEKARERWETVKTVTGVIAFVAFMWVAAPIIIVSMPSF